MHLSVLRDCASHLTMFATEVKPGRKRISTIHASSQKSIPAKEGKELEAVRSRIFLSFPGFILLSLMTSETVRSSSGVRSPKKKGKNCFSTFCAIEAKHAKSWNVKVCIAYVHASENRGGRLCLPPQQLDGIERSQRLCFVQ